MILLFGAEIYLLTVRVTFSCPLSSQTQLWIFFSQFQISPRLALKHRRADGCVGISFCYLLFTHLSFTFPLCSSLAALQTWAVYNQRARCLTCWGSVGSLESFWHLFADMRRRHKDCHARMQPTRVSSPFLCSHACLLDLVSKVSVP